MYVDVSEVYELAADMERNADAIPAKVRTIVHRGGFDTLSTMQAGTPVDTGNLRSSESVDFTDDGLGFEVGPTAEYGDYVEEGTSKMRAEPYAGPAADRVFPGIEDALGDTAADVVGRV